MAANEIAELLRRSAAEFLRGHEQRVKCEVGSTPSFDHGLWREMAELGWLGLGLPEVETESGTGLREATVLCEQFGRVAWSAPYIACSVLPSALLARNIANVQGLDGLASSCAAGERPFAVAWQEQSRQPDDALPETRLIDGRLSGVKRFVAAAESNSVLLVSAHAAGKIVLLAVEANAPGVSLEQYSAGLTSESTVRFDNAPILLNRPLATEATAQDALTNALHAGRIALCAELAGLASGLLDKTLAYVGNRVQFGRPISSFQAIRHRCVDLYIATRLASASWNHALQCFESAPQAVSTAVAINAAKARCGDVAVQVGREAVQMHGAMGFTEEGGVGVYLRAALHGRAWLGAPLTHRRRFMSGSAELRQDYAESHSG